MIAMSVDMNIGDTRGAGINIRKSPGQSSFITSLREMIFPGLKRNHNGSSWEDTYAKEVEKAWEDFERKANY